jgi:hypothetical protein
MPPSRLLVSLAAAGCACTAVSSCSIAGKMFAGGQGDPTLYDVVPVTPSVPVQTGEYLVRLGKVVTNPADLTDQYVALKDTVTINIQPGPASDVIAVSGEYLDPRINDLVYLRDRGNQIWEAIDTTTGVNMAIVTDATGAPQEYIVGTNSVATIGGNIFSQRTYDFGFPIGNPPGLYYALVNADDNGNRPLNTGDYQYFVLRADGIGQWERDTGTSIMRYWVDPALNLEGQFTEFNSGDQPPNIEEADVLVNDIVITTGQRTETNHTDGTHIQTYVYGPPPGFIAPVNDGGQWNGKPSVVQGTFGGRPWIFVANNTPLSMTVNNATVQCTVTDTQTSYSDTFDIIYLTGGSQDIYFDGIQAGLGIQEDDMVAIKSLGAGGYLLLDLFRNTSPGDGNLSEAGGDVLTVTQYNYGTNGAADTPVGQYIVNTLSQ